MDEIKYAPKSMEKKSKSKKKYSVNNRHKAQEMLTIVEWSVIIFFSYYVAFMQYNSINMRLSLFL